MYWKSVGISTLLLVFLSACAGSREAIEPEEDAVELPRPAVNLADFEDFDPMPYEEPAPEPLARLEHDVPARLMEGRADEGIRSTMQGYRVQVHLSLDKNIAVAEEENVREWLAESSLAPSGLNAIYIVYGQPYYRVRVGNFTSRQGAERARQFLSERYPDAVIVPDTVEITR